MANRVSEFIRRGKITHEEVKFLSENCISERGEPFGVTIEELIQLGIKKKIDIAHQAVAKAINLDWCNYPFIEESFRNREPKTKGLEEIQESDKAIFVLQEDWAKEIRDYLRSKGGW